jgi:aromatic ring-cleaving dioxygenase
MTPAKEKTIVSAQAKGTGSIEDEDVTAPGVQPGRAGALGFRAKLAGIGLWDLVQMECLARSRVVVLVTGEGGIGYLYFDNGQVVHAVTTEQIGEPAALEILGWTNGSFQPCDRPWPEVATIATSHEALILQVAKRRDESSNLVAFPARNAPADDLAEEIEMFEIEEEGAPKMRTPNERELPSAPPAARAEAGGGEYSVILRLGAHGEILSNSGGSEELAETAAYVRRLTELAGELLGIEGFCAFECTFKESRCFVFVESNGDTVLLRPRSETNVQALRERLGLL